MPASPHFAVVMAGGSGTRFWPRSRARVPKQLLALAGPRTLLQDAVARMAGLVGWSRVLVVSGERHADAVRRQLPRLAAAQHLMEPTGRNTAPAIALAALWIARHAPEACMTVVPADHVIGDLPRFRRTMTAARRVAVETGALVTLGLRPTRPETGFGYIRPGRRIAGAPGGAAWVERFIEKPNAAHARRLVASRRAFWNSGMFVWRVDRILAELERHLPAVMAALGPAVGRRTRGALTRAYRRLPSVSIDTGVMERADRVAVVPARFPWSDVGSWAAVGDLWRSGADGNAVRGRAVLLESRGCVVDSPERLVAVLGLEDVVVVDTADALLVCRKDRAQDVRRIVATLVRRRLGRYV